ncbi:hypothetical protein PVAP13_7KG009100 [Panicum virgatum]|uniref:Uncharacterized protein n=1 Tax=Panicum virgatum TaxID=38727 RepID=A0A8T0QES3_PANVG|nr:hypothetical protein PVAP13_7KG009100 [Panicum virgatum]
MLVFLHLLAGKSGRVVQAEEDFTGPDVVVDHLGMVASRERLGELRHAGMTWAAAGCGTGAPHEGGPVQQMVCIQASSCTPVRRPSSRRLSSPRDWRWRGELRVLWLDASCRWLNRWMSRPASSTSST